MQPTLKPCLPLPARRERAGVRAGNSISSPFLRGEKILSGPRRSPAVPGGPRRYDAGAGQASLPVFPPDGFQSAVRGDWQRRIHFRFNCQRASPRCHADGAFAGARTQQRPRSFSMGHPPAHQRPNCSTTCAPVKSSDAKLARRLREETTMTLTWIDNRPNMGATGSLANLLRHEASRP
jgi:hypothetical protein